MALGAYEVNDEGNLLAYSTDNTGFRQYSLAVMDLRTHKLLPDHIEKTGAVVWANDNKTLFYTVEDSAKRQYRLYRHTVGTVGPDALVYEEKDERFNVFAFKTRSKAYIFMVSGSRITTEARYIPADQPASEWKLIEPRRQGVEYYPDHNGEFFYIRSNDSGRNFRLVRAPVANPGRKHWQEIIPERPNVMLDELIFSRTITSFTSTPTACRRCR